jgi:hypothetical protein
LTENVPIKIVYLFPRIGIDSEERTQKRSLQKENVGLVKRMFIIPAIE